MMSKGASRLTQRLQDLKRSYLAVRPSITIHRAMAFTEVFKQAEGLGEILSKNILRAKGFKRACETAPMLIQDHELIVGHPCGAPRAGAFSPDIAWEWFEVELDSISTRDQDPYFISEDDKGILRSEVFPFWKGKSLAEACEEAFRKADLWEFGAVACISDLTYHMSSGGGDTSPGYDIILFKKGVNGIRSEAQDRLEKLEEKRCQAFGHSIVGFDDEKTIAAMDHYRAAIETCDGVLAYAKRLSDHALKMAEVESDPVRREELLKISKINARVPANPPETFHEALQSIWTIQSLFLMEENQCSTSLGRLDQYLLPYFVEDLKKGFMSEEEAFELFGCFIIKCSEMIWYTPGATAKYFAGYMPYINMTVGGVKRDGGDGTNELTYLIMDAVEKVKLYQPSLACRIHNQSPQRYLEKIVDVIDAGVGMPACHFDDAHIRMMLRKGFDFDDARDYCLMGCVEPQRSGRIHQWTAGGFTQWPTTIELALNGGVLKSYGEKVWLDTGDPCGFETYEDFEDAVKKQLNHMLVLNGKGTMLVQEVFRDHNPTPYMSLFVEGCMESGKDVTAGGAVLHDGPGTIFAGLGTFADSMAAIRKLVYEEKRYTMENLKNSLDVDWVGFDRMRRDFMDAPKFGNDDDYVDRIAKDIVDHTERVINLQPSLYARQIHGTLSQSFNTPLGGMIGATPDGRSAGMPLSDGMSPSQGADRKGATAVIKSVSKINVEAMSLGMSHNFKITRNALSSPEGRVGVIGLLKTASIMGNAQMQFNCVDNQTLLEAQKNPEAYRDLIVRVAGYSAFFVELCKEVQDEIISRTVLS